MTAFEKSGAVISLSLLVMRRKDTDIRTKINQRRKIRKGVQRDKSLWCSPQRRGVRGSAHGVTTAEQLGRVVVDFAEQALACVVDVSVVVWYGTDQYGVR